MEETEVPLEKLHEDIEHSAQHAGHSSRWITWSALLSALLAVLAAVAALNSGHHANEAMMAQIRASDGWAFFQAKGIKMAILESRSELYKAIGHAGPDLSEKIGEYAKQQGELKSEAQKEQLESTAHFRRHETFAQAVTFFQIAIAVTAIAVLARRRRFLSLSVLFGILGSYYLALGFVLH